AVGASPKKRGIEDEIRTQNFTPQQEEEIQLFYLRGGVHISKLGVYDKLLMALLKMKLKRKKHLDADERGMLSAYSHPVDFTKEGYIEEIAAAVNQYGTTL
ncbi:MAG: hypothetical protein PF495_14095, partial [Spirochaetales bacterium]|nr:hypothetical protein [Spirochaetales bacterium]